MSLITYNSWKFTWSKKIKINVYHCEMTHACSANKEWLVVLKFKTRFPAKPHKISDNPSFLSGWLIISFIRKYKLKNVLKEILYYVLQLVLSEERPITET